MPKIKVPSVSQAGTWEDLRRFTDVILSEVVSTINGRIGLTENTDSQTIPVSFAAANTDTVINHTLKRVPVGYLSINPSVAMQVYTGSTPATTTAFYLRSSAVGTTTVILF